MVTDWGAAQAVSSTALKSKLQITLLNGMDGSFF
jgi:hypothetical protein